jgi:hypothetical protein
MVTTEDNLPKSEPENFRKISKKMGHGVIFVDDCVAYVVAATKAGLRAFHSSEYCSPLVENLCLMEKLPCIRSFSDLRAYAALPDWLESKERRKKHIFRKLKKKLFGKKELAQDS